MWQPIQIRHRSAYYDAFFTEALLSFAETGLATPAETEAIRRASTEMVDFCLKTSREDVFSRDGNRVSVITALAPNPHPRFSRFFAQIKQDLGFGIYVPGLRHHRLLVFGRDASRLDRSDPRSAACSISMPAIRSVAASTNRL